MDTNCQGCHLLASDLAETTIKLRRTEAALEEALEYLRVMTNGSKFARGWIQDIIAAQLWCQHREVRAIQRGETNG